MKPYSLLIQHMEIHVYQPRIRFPSLFFWSNIPFHKNLSNNRVCHLKKMVRELKQRVLGQSIRWFITSSRNETKGDRWEGLAQHDYVMEHPSESHHSLVTCDQVNKVLRIWNTDHIFNARRDGLREACF